MLYLTNVSELYYIIYTRKHKQLSIGMEPNRLEFYSISSSIIKVARIGLIYDEGFSMGYRDYGATFIINHNLLLTEKLKILIGNMISEKKYELHLRLPGFSKEIFLGTYTEKE